MTKTISLFLLAIVLLAPQTSSAELAQRGTTLLGIWTPDTVVIGVDSRETDVRNPGASREVCKVKEVNGVIFAVSGLPRYKPTGFDLMQSLTSVCSLNVNLFSLANVIVREIRPQLDEVMSDLSKRLPVPTDAEKEALSIGILLGGLANDAPALAAILFRITSCTDCPNNYKIDTWIECYPPTPDAKGWKFIGLGHSDYARAFAEKNQEFLQQKPIEAVQKLLDTQIKSAPTSAAGPVNVASITRAGIHWIAQSQRCGEKSHE